MSTRRKMESAAKIALNKKNEGRNQVLIDTRIQHLERTQGAWYS